MRYAHPLSLFTTPSGKPIQIKAHRALWSGAYPENSLAALEECLRVGVARAEIDVAPLADHDFALLHGRRLEEATDGEGPVRELTAGEAVTRRLRWRGQLTDHRVALLSDAVGRIASIDGPTVIELDIAAIRPLPQSCVDELVRLVQPIKHRVVLTCADWNLRRILRVDPTLAAGTGLWPYLDWVPAGSEWTPADIGIPQGLHGYYDAHVMAQRPWSSVRDYLSDRIGGILRLVPGTTEAHVGLALFERLLDDMPDAGELFHRDGVKLDVYTLNAGTPGWEAGLERLVAAGVDMITSDTPRELAAAGMALPV